MFSKKEQNKKQQLHQMNAFVNLFFIQSFVLVMVIVVSNCVQLRVCFKHLQLITNSDSQFYWLFCPPSELASSYWMWSHSLNWNDKLIELISFELWVHDSQSVFFWNWKCILYNVQCAWIVNWITDIFIFTTILS